MTIHQKAVYDYKELYKHLQNAVNKARQEWSEMVNQIDITEKGITAFLKRIDQSEQMFYHGVHGIEYFHYPVDNQVGCIESMVKFIPEFCKYIDKGDFYIACAMGLHRTDIALCTYWIFYGADKGIVPPPIRGYRKENGHNSNKIMRVLNAMYQFMTERDGVEPIPIEVFKARKKIITEMSRI